MVRPPLLLLPKDLLTACSPYQLQLPIPGSVRGAPGNTRRRPPPADGTKDPRRPMCHMLHYQRDGCQPVGCPGTHVRPVAGLPLPNTGVVSAANWPGTSTQSRREGHGNLPTLCRSEGRGPYCRAVVPTSSLPTTTSPQEAPRKRVSLPTLRRRDRRATPPFSAPSLRSELGAK